ncbi:YopX family protein [Cytobacillus solani]|uniref:YopX family protein n=1 Tax=Cytobacillus solani TaxID=1637975 RepID=UPI00207947A6|nr:YopX family protein [Cytobacillus solani]USK56539.1 YopX family protein [Cytobacillus solani]
MREIKFRAWEKNLKEIIPVDNIDFEKRMINTNSAWRLFDEVELMQYTGLKDNNEKEIYEKDVCEIWIGCKQDGYYIVEDLQELYLDMNHADSYYRITRIVVVGNIFDNPELLEGAQ